MTRRPIVLGIDFDNTIVGYDALFHRVARELNVIPATVAANKNAVRDHLNSTGQKDVFTEMQGTVYGARMAGAEACPGVIESLTTFARAGVPFFIISHKTRTPIIGTKHDLHAAARGWLELQGFFDPGRVGLAAERVFFELTKEAKLDRIAACACTHFIDDLPEILFHPDFPHGVERILYDPTGHATTPRPCRRLTSWQMLPELLHS